MKKCIVNAVPVPASELSKNKILHTKKMLCFAMLFSIYMYIDLCLVATEICSHILDNESATQDIQQHVRHTP